MTVAFETGDTSPGIVEIRRSTLRLLFAIVRNPLAALPAACFDQRMVVTSNLGLKRAYVSDPALIHEALVRNADKLEKNAEMKEVLGRALGDGLLTSDGAVWRRQRQTVAPAFQPDNLHALIPPMIAAAGETRDRWLAMPSRATVDLSHEMMRTTFRIILDTMLSGPDGVDADAIERSVTDFLGATSWMFALALLKAPRGLPFPGKRRAQAATALMRQTVQDRIARRRHDAASRDDLIGLLLAAADPETGQRMSDTMITDNILTFIGAGHETTAVALGWTFALLAENPACRARLLAEVDLVTGTGPVRVEHIGQLTYTRQVVSEAMRLYPPAPIVGRSVTWDLELAGVPIPAGSIIFVPIYAVHRHHAIWPDPDHFDPERFAPEAVKARHRFAYLPFGIGQRTCIGTGVALLEAVAILAVLSKVMTLEPVGPIPEALMRVTLRPRTPLRMRVARR